MSSESDKRDGFELREERLRIAEDLAGVGAFELDLRSDQWITTLKVASLFGIDANSSRPHLSYWEQPIFVDDRHKLRAAILAAAKDGAFNAEFRVTHIDGGVHWISAKGETARDSDGAVRWLRGVCIDITERKVLEARLLALSEALDARVRERTRALEESNRQLRESEGRFRLLVQSVTDYAIFMLDANGNIVNWNPGAERLKGYKTSEIVGQNFSRFYTEEEQTTGTPVRLLRQAADTGKAEAEGWRVRKDGSRFWANVVIHPILDSQGQLLGFSKVTRDLTEKRAADEQMRHAQKMEAIGQITGGVAHDFNNLLQVISSSLQTLQRRRLSVDTEAAQRLVAAAMHGTSRAAALVSRLLAFSRRQPLDPQPIAVNTFITRTSELLRRTLPETISIETVLAGGVWDVLADPSQLENALLNLAVNSRDAMPDGGKLTLEAANVYLDDEYAVAAEVPTGQYVGIFVSDTGTGMTSDVADKAFDPFFTTKEAGHGTGLGLSQVFGFVKQSGGHVKIYSEFSYGTTIKIYLPRYYSSVPSVEEGTTAEVPRGRGELVLITEDEYVVRQFGADMMRELGYEVLDASDATTALSIIDGNSEIALLFTDVGLPGGMNGRQLADEARRRRPDLKVLFATGYARNAIVHHGRLDPGVQLITKPYTFAALAMKLRQVLDAE